MKKPEIAPVLPEWARTVVSSGMSVGVITALAMNLLFFHVGRRQATQVSLATGEADSLDELNAMNEQEFVTTLRPLVNNPIFPLEAVWEALPFTDINQLRAAIHAAVRTAPSEQH